MRFLAAFELVVGKRPPNDRTITSLPPPSREVLVMRVQAKYADGRIAKQIMHLMAGGIYHGDQTEQPYPFFGER
jgi:hypothetical protein